MPNYTSVCMMRIKLFTFLPGPSGVGVNELRRKLIEINPRTFRGATPRQYTLALAPLVTSDLLVLHQSSDFLSVYRHDEATEDVRGTQAGVSLHLQGSV